MITGRTIICLASAWDYDPTSKHHVMRVLSQHDNEIVWVNYHASRRPRASAADLRTIARKLAGAARRPQQVVPHITVVTPLVLPLPGSAAAAAINRALVVRQVRRVLRGLPDRPVQLWSFAPDAAALAGAFGEERFIYYCVDEFAAFDGYDRDAIRAAEDRTLAAADLVITTSAALFDARRERHPHVRLVPHGVDVDHFAAAATAPPPAELADIRGPVLGFFGLISHWVDIDLLAAVARARPDWTLVLIGEPRVDVAPLAALPNVRLLGRRPYAALPACCRRFDAGLIPFVVDELTRAVNPIKLREYLAAGLPVVCTPLPEARRYASEVEIAARPEEFIAACQRAIASRGPAEDERRRAAVASERWELRVAEISRHLAALSPRVRPCRSPGEPASPAPGSPPVRASSP